MFAWFARDQSQLGWESVSLVLKEVIRLLWNDLSSLQNNFLHLFHFSAGRKPTCAEPLVPHTGSYITRAPCPPVCLSTRCPSGIPVWIDNFKNRVGHYASPLAQRNHVWAEQVHVRGRRSLISARLSSGLLTSPPQRYRRWAPVTVGLGERHHAESHSAGWVRAGWLRGSSVVFGEHFNFFTPMRDDRNGWIPFLGWENSNRVQCEWEGGLWPLELGRGFLCLTDSWNIWAETWKKTLHLGVKRLRSIKIMKIPKDLPKMPWMPWTGCTPLTVEYQQLFN